MFVIDGIANTYLTSCFMVVKNVVVTGNSDSRDNCKRKYINVFDFVNKLKFPFQT